MLNCDQLFYCSTTNSGLLILVCNPLLKKDLLNSVKTYLSRLKKSSVQMTRD